MRKLFVMLAIVILAMPASAQNLTLKIDDDPYKSSISACAPDNTQERAPTDKTTIRLCGLKSRSTPVVKTAMLVLLQVNKSRWMDYRSATKLGGEEVKMQSTKTVGSCRDGCTYYDTVGIILTLPQVEECASTGFSVKLWGSVDRELFASAEHCTLILKWLQSSSEQ